MGESRGLHFGLYAVKILTFAFLCKTAYLIPYQKRAIANKKCLEF